MRDRTAVLRAAGIAVVVGTILTLVNQGDRIVSGDAGLGLWVRVGVTYLVPFVVANLGAIGARMSFGAAADDERVDG